MPAVRVGYNVEDKNSSLAEVHNMEHEKHNKEGGKKRCCTMIAFKNRGTFRRKEIYLKDKAKDAYNDTLCDDDTLKGWIMSIH